MSCFCIIENTRPVGYNLQTIEVPIKKTELQPHLKNTIDRIDVFYDKENGEHELIIRFKLPLVDGKKDLSLSLKKQKGRINGADTRYPRSKQLSDG